MPTESDDPSDVAVLVVHADDVVTALAATAQGRETVLRVTPPFLRRQRARIHVPSESAGESVPAGPDADQPAPLSVPANAFVDDEAPSFPRAPDTEPASPDTPAYDVDEHFERHEDAVATWRDSIPEHFRDVVVHETDDGHRCEFEVRYLGE